MINLYNKFLKLNDTIDFEKKIKAITSNSKMADVEKIVKIENELTNVKDTVNKKLVDNTKSYIKTWKANRKAMTERQRELIEGGIEDDINNVIKESKTKFTYVKKWMTSASDVGPCDFCKGLEGKEVPLTENWSHQGYDNLIPGKVHKGCRCYYVKIKKDK